MKSKSPNSIFIIAASLTISGCAYNTPQNSLEKVAKDWSMTVRASQVMPLYPLEEDLRPGDLYVITRSIDSEIETWKEKGFLPLVNRYDRLKPAEEAYTSYYKDGPYIEDSPSYTRLPRVAFPSYTFEIDKRRALGIAIPLNAVPLALSISGAQSATGSVVFKNASTQGLPDSQMNKAIQSWGDANRPELIKLRKDADANNHPLLIRLITRVFKIQGATVNLAFDQVEGFGVQAGAPVIAPDLTGSSLTQYNSLIAHLNKQIELKSKPTEAPTPEIRNSEEEESSSNTTIEDLKNDLEQVKKLKSEYQIKALKNSIERISTEDRFGGYLLPGASVKVIGRSSRGVTMEEKFEKPLVLGYWASEYYVTQEGDLINLGPIKNLIDNQQEYLTLRKKAIDTASKPAQGPNPDKYNNLDQFPGAKK